MERLISIFDKAAITIAKGSGIFTNRSYISQTKKKGIFSKRNNPNTEYKKNNHQSCLKTSK